MTPGGGSFGEENENGGRRWKRMEFHNSLPSTLKMTRDDDEEYL